MILSPKLLLIASLTSNKPVSWATEFPDPVGITPSLKLWRLFESFKPFTTSFIEPSPPKTIILSKRFFSILET